MQSLHHTVSEIWYIAGFSTKNVQCVTFLWGFRGEQVICVLYRKYLPLSIQMTAEMFSQCIENCPEIYIIAYCQGQVICTPLDHIVISENKFWTVLYKNRCLHLYSFSCFRFHVFLIMHCRESQSNLRQVVLIKYKLKKTDNIKLHFIDFFFFQFKVCFW